MIKQSYKFVGSENHKILYEKARNVAVPKIVSEQMCSGGVGAAVLAKSGKIYTGVCIDTDCSLGMCAERNALSTMITNGDFEIDTVIAVTKVGKVISPCGACREFMSQFGKPQNIKIILDNKDTTVLLNELMPYPY